MKKCINCGSDLNTGDKYCSRKCQTDYTWNQYVKRVDEENIFFNCVGIKYNGGNGPKRAKRYLIEKHGHQCVICKNTEWMGKPIPLTLDHINGNPDDWRVENLRVICPNCDRQTPTYGGKNKGNGKMSNRTKTRMEKYYDEKLSLL